MINITIVGTFVLLRLRDDNPRHDPLIQHEHETKLMGLGLVTYIINILTYLLNMSI